MSSKVNAPTSSFRSLACLHARDAGAEQARDRHAQPGRQSLHHRVALGVHAGVVERVRAVADAQEAGRLLEGLAEKRGTSRSCARD